MVSIIIKSKILKKTMNPYHCQKTTNRRCSHTKTVIRILSLVAFMTVIAAAVSVSVRSDEKVLHKTLRGVEVGEIHGPEYMIAKVCSFKGLPLPEGVCGWKPYIHN